MKEAAENSVHTILAPFTAILAATAVSLLFDIAVCVARGWSPELGYVGLCAALSLGAALVLGGALGWTRRPEIALAAWVALNILLEAMLYVSPGWLSAASFAAVTWAGLLPNGRRRESPASIGIAVGLAMSLCAVILPRLFGVLGLDRPHGGFYQLTVMATLAAVLLAHSFYARFRRQIRWLPAETTLSLAVLSVLALLVPLAVTGPPTQSAVEELDGPSLVELRPAGAEPPRAVIVLVLDTVRADHLSLYGYERDTTPALRDFVERHERAVVYPMAFSPSSWTLPAHASLFTGLVPSAHGAHSGQLLDLRHTLASGVQLTAETTLAEVMQSRGYRTAAILANAQVLFFNGMDRGFDQVVRPQADGWLALTGEQLRRRLVPRLYAHALKPYPHAATISREVLRFLDQCEPAACFVVANYMEAHWPFAASPPYQGAYTEGQWPGVESARYDEELLGLDAAVGELLHELEQRGVLDRAWLVITADHGEEFGELGAKHGTSVYNALVRIPLIVHPPIGETVADHRDAVGLLDVTATLTAAVGASPLGAGRDLRTLSRASPVQIEWYGEPSLPPAHRTTGRAVVVGRSKLIESKGARELYRLETDPFEQNDVAAKAPEDVRALAELLPPLTSSPGGVASDERELSVDEIERLRALGYAD